MHLANWIGDVRVGTPSTFDVGRLIEFYIIIASTRLIATYYTIGWPVIGTNFSLLLNNYIIYSM